MLLGNHEEIVNYIRCAAKNWCRVGPLLSPLEISHFFCLIMNHSLEKSDYTSAYLYPCLQVPIAGLRTGLGCRVSH